MHKSDGVDIDLGKVVMFGAGGNEVVVLGVARVCDGGARFLEAENVYRIIASIF